MFPPAPDYGLEFNKQRGKRRIMLLPVSWKTTDSTATGQTWMTPDTTFSIDTGYRKLKSIRVQAGNIVYEEDWVEHYLKDSSFNEYLVFSYDYDSLLPHRVMYSRSGDSAVQLSKSDGDSLLRIWHVERYPR